MPQMTTRLRALVRRGRFLGLPSVYDPISARIAEEAGFETLYNGGFVTGGKTCLCEPLLTMTEQEFIAARKSVEDLAGLEESYRIERETVEHVKRSRTRKRPAR
jgi:2-methylisocitrate lyase-like PEP mutase family enzyme